MLQIESISNQARFAFLWACSVALGWTAITYPVMTFQSARLSSWSMLFPISMRLLISSLLLGGIIGLLQYLLYRIENILSWRWIVVSAVSYGLGTFCAFSIISIIAGIMHPEIFSSNGASFLIMPTELIMLISGGLTALIQGLALGKILFQNSRALLAWVLAVALSWELALFSSAFFGKLNIELSLPAQSGFVGIIIGLGTAFFLSVQINALNNKI